MINNEEIFAKSVVNLNTEAVNKIIDILTIDTLFELRNKKAQAAAIVTVNDKLDFVIMYFYRAGSRMIGFQYIIKYGIDEQNSNILCILFAKHALRLQKLSGIKQTHTLKNLAEYYGLQIKGYKEHLKQPKQ